MNIEERLQELSQLSCPRQVDVVDSVMAEVRQHPYLRPASRPLVWRRIAVTAAAAVAALVVINVSILYSRSYDEEQISSMMAFAQDYDSYGTVESDAVNPIEYLYDDTDEQ